VSPKVIITTPYPTSEEIAEFYKIPPKRVAELNEMIAEIRRSMARAEERKKKKAARNRRLSSKKSAARKAKKPVGR
jgi:hypothetical protein